MHYKYSDTLPVSFLTLTDDEGQEEVSLRPGCIVEIPDRFKNDEIIGRLRQRGHLAIVEIEQPVTSPVVEVADIPEAVIE